MRIVVVLALFSFSAIAVKSESATAAARDISVTSVGAKGDCTTDDQASIQRAIDLVGGAGGGDVIFPSGCYRISAGLTVRYRGVRLIGRSRATILLIASGTNTYAIEVTADSFVAEGLIVEGPTHGAYVANEHAIYAHGTAEQPLRGFKVVNSEIFHFGSHGVLCAFVTEVSEVNNYFHNLGYAAAQHLNCHEGTFAHNRIKTISPGSQNNMYGVSLTHGYAGNSPVQPPSSRWLVLGNSIEDINWTGIDGHAASEVRVIGNVLKSCKNPIDIGASSNQAAYLSGQDIVISGNLIEPGTRANATASGGINVGGSSEMHEKNVVISGNVVRGQGVVGNENSGAINAYFVDRLTIANNIVDTFGGAGIMLAGQCQWRFDQRQHYW